MNANELRLKVERTANLPSLPAVVTKILSTVDDPRANASQLNELIGAEPALATRMLRLANSAYFGRRNGIVSLPQCAVVLGFNTIRSLALSASIQQMVLRSPARNFDMTAFWRHSLGTGAGARALARRAGTDPEAAMSAGLVHDIGRLVLDVVAPDDYEDVLEAVKKGCPEEEAEKEMFGASHGQVGGWLAIKWKLPPAIVAAIEWHHQPASAGEYQLVTSVVRLADEMAECLTGGRKPEDLGPELWTDAGLRPEDAAALAGEFVLEWALAEKVMGAGAGAPTEVAKAA